jgi:hypothetical protein
MKRFLVPLLLVTSLAATEIPEGLDQGDWSSIGEAYQQTRHQFFKQADGNHVAHNPGQNWRLEFDENGFTARNGDWTWGLEIAARRHGSSEDHRLQVPLEPTKAGNHLAVPRTAHLTEWVHQ